MTRSEHVEWAKGRALTFLPDDPAGAVVSMLMDLERHPETARMVSGPLGQIGMMEAADGDPESVRRFIEGFN